MCQALYQGVRHVPKSTNHWKASMVPQSESNTAPLGILGQYPFWITSHFFLNVFLLPLYCEFCYPNKLEKLDFNSKEHDLIPKIRPDCGRTSYTTQWRKSPLNPWNSRRAWVWNLGSKDTAFPYYSMALNKLLNFVSYVNETVLVIYGCVKNYSKISWLKMFIVSQFISQESRGTLAGYFLLQLSCWWGLPSSQSSTLGKSASKLTHMAVGRPQKIHFQAYPMVSPEGCRKK